MGSGGSGSTAAGATEPDGIVIRDATAQDADVIGRLFIEVDETFPEAFGTAAGMAEYVRRSFGDGAPFSPATTRVAEEDGKAVGICVSYAKEPTFAPADADGIDGLSETFCDAMASQADDARESLRDGYAYLDCIIVDEGHRRHGIGRRLIDDALGRLGPMMLYCRSDNAPALALYRSAGMRMLGMMFGMSEDGESIGSPMVVLASARSDRETARNGE